MAKPCCLEFPSGTSPPITKRFPGDVSTTGYERSCGTRRAMETNYLYSMPIKKKTNQQRPLFLHITCFNWLLCGERSVYPVLNFKTLSDVEFGICPETPASPTASAAKAIVETSPGKSEDDETCSVGNGNNQRLFLKNSFEMKILLLTLYFKVLCIFKLMLVKQQL